ncbi:MAG: YceI family protein [Leptospirales bacterium]
MKALNNLLIAAFLIAASPTVSHAIELVTLKTHSKIVFSVSHFVFSHTDGHFNDFQGTIDLNEQELTRSRIDFTVRTDSIDTANPKRDKHLRSPDFFDVTRFPVARFTSTGITKKKNGNYLLKGNLTIHGKTKNIAFTLHDLGERKGANGVEKAHFTAMTVLDRRDFGITYDKTGIGIGKKVTLTVDAIMVPNGFTPSSSGATRQ